MRLSRRKRSEKDGTVRSRSCRKRELKAVAWDGAKVADCVLAFAHDVECLVEGLRFFSKDELKSLKEGNSRPVCLEPFASLINPRLIYPSPFFVLCLTFSSAIQRPSLSSVLQPFTSRAKRNFPKFRGRPR
jgi:hypothetical protein